MNIARILGVLVVAALVAAGTSAAHAALIPGALTGVTGTAFHQGDNADPGNGSISRALNGSGLTVGDPGDPSTWTHDAAWPNNWQGGGAFADSQTPGAWLVMDLGAAYSSLTDLYVWNVREVLDRGVQDVDLYYAVSPTVAPATGSPYDFTSGGWTSWGSHTIAQGQGGGTPVDTIINLQGIPYAQYIGFDIQSNYGSTFRVGFAELQVTVPEPTTLLIWSLLAGLGIGLGWRRRQR